MEAPVSEEIGNRKIVPPGNKRDSSMIPCLPVV